MVALTGLEKFSHLEDKIYRTIELTKTLRQEKEELERQLANLRGLGGDKQNLATHDAVIALDPAAAEAVSK